MRSCANSGSCQPSPVIVTVDASATDDTPGTAAILSMIAWCMRATAASSLTCDSGIEQAERLHLVRPDEPGMDAAQHLERANHQSRADEQHERQRDLHDGQRVARPMALPARARGSSSAAEEGADLRACVLEHRDGAEEEPDDDRQHEREQERRERRARCPRGAAGCPARASPGGAARRMPARAR